MRGVLVMIIVWAVCAPVIGQGPAKCGTTSSLEIFEKDYDLFLKGLQTYRPTSNRKSGAMMTTIPLQLHIIRNDDGSEIVLMSDIEEGLQRANDLFAIANLQFVVCDEIRYVNSTADKRYTSQEPNALIDPDQANPYALNVYYFGEVYVGTTEVCGLGGREVYMGCPTGNTLAHEIGHHYALLHTHGDYNFEPPDYATLPTETNGFPTPVVVEGAARYFANMRDDNANQIFDCLETGDGVCDTPAEPVYLDRMFDRVQCTYFGTATDYFGDLYEPDPGNVMSYGSCNEERFTLRQMDRALFALNTFYLNEQCGGCTGEQTEWVVTSAEDFGKGSLRWAYACNKSADRKLRITFDIPGENIINLSSALFAIIGDEVTIDGLNQATGEKITIRNHGLEFNSRKVVLRNLILEDAVGQFSSGIRISGGASVTVEDCEIYGSTNTIIASAADTVRLRSNIFGGEMRPNDNAPQFFGSFNRIEIGGSTEEGNVISHNLNGSAIYIEEALGGFISGNEIVSAGRFGLSIRSAHNFSISNNNVSNHPDYGILIQSIEQSTITGNVIRNNNGIGVSINSGVDLLISDNMITGTIQTANSDGDGLLLLGGDGITVTRNKIRDNGRMGIAVFFDPQNIRLGSYDTVDANVITGNTSGVIVNRAPQAFSGINHIFCNDNQAFDIQSGANNNKQRPVISEAGPAMIAGTAGPMDTIILYTNRDTCTTCQSELFIGLAYADGAGDWSYDISTVDLPLGLKVSASATLDGRTSELSQCKNLEVPVGCVDLVDQFSYENGFESDIVDDFRVLGSDFSLYETDHCADLDSFVLFYNGRTPEDTESILYSRSFDLIGATFAVLEFDLAHGTSFSNRQSALSVEVSTDCGLTYETVYDKRTLNGLRTTTDNGNDDDYFPTSCDEWRTESIDLIAYTGKEILIKFTASIFSFSGQNVFLDNILVDRAGACPTTNDETGELYIGIEESSIILCEGETTDLAYDFTGNEVRWYIDDLPTPDFDPVQPIGIAGMYIAEVVNNFGCRLYDTLQVEVLEVPVFDLGADITACGGDVLYLVSAADATEVSWLYNGETLMNELSDTLIPDQSGLYIAIATIQDQCPYRDTISIDINEIPIGSVSGDTLVCSFDEAIVTLDTDAPRIAWSLDDAPYEPIDSLSFTTGDVGTYSVRISDISDMCFDVLSVEIEKTVPIELDFGRDTAICFGDQIVIDIDTVGGAETQWYVDDQLLSEGDFTRALTETGNYRFDLIDSIGCLYSEEVALTVFDTIALSLTATSDRYCAGETAEITAETDGEIVLWLRDEEPLVEQPTSRMISETGTYSIIVENDIGCSATAALTVEFVDPPVTDLGDDQVLCEGTSALLEVADLGYQYEWFLDGDPYPEVDPAITTDQPGTYMLRQTDDLGCSSDDEVMLTFIPGPFIELPLEVFTCPGVPLTITPSTNASDLQWTYGDEQVIAEDDGSITAIELGTYTLVGAGSSGCEVVARIEVLRYDLPEVPLDEVYRLCPGDVIDLDLQGVGVDYIWRLGDEVIEEGMDNLSVTAPGDYSVAITDANGCASPTDFQVIAEPVPVIGTRNSFEGCAGEVVTLFVDSDAEMFTWALDGELIDGQTGATLDATLEGIYTITGINDRGCSTAVSTSLALAPRPEVDLLDQLSVCLGDTVSIDAGDHSTYLWSTGADTRDIMVASIDPAGSRSEHIALQVSNEAGCTSSDTIAVSYLGAFRPVLDISVSQVCIGEEVDLMVDMGTSFDWIGLDMTTSSITIDVDTTTTFEVAVLDDCLSDPVLLDTTVVVSDSSSIAITQDTCITLGDQLQLVVTGIESATWEAHSSFVTATDIANPIVSPIVDRAYRVSVQDTMGCTYQYSVAVCVEGITDSFAAPNVITPEDQDGYNDALLFDGLERISGARLVVFNRWGNEVFTHGSYQTDDRLFRGLTADGTELPGGNYFYVLTIPSFTEVIKSSLTILR